jgi:hypothetical protein
MCDNICVSEDRFFTPLSKGEKLLIGFFGEVMEKLKESG